MTRSILIAVHIVLFAFVGLHFGGKAQTVALPRAGRTVVAATVDTTDTEVRQAIHLWRLYAEAVRSGREADVSEIWSTKDRQYGTCTVFPWGFCIPVEVLQEKSDRVVAVHKMPDRIRLQVQWVNPGGSIFFPCTVYAIRKENRMLLAQPIAAMTQGWEKRTVGHFRYCFYPGHRFSRRAAEAMERFWIGLFERLDVGQPFPVLEYILDPRDRDFAEELGPHGLGEVFTGRVFINAGRDSEYFPHEAVHVLQNQRLADCAPAPLLSEGMATYFGGQDISKEATLLGLKRELEYTEVSSIDTLLSSMGGGRQWHHWVRYVGAAVTGCLFERYGTEKYKQLWAGASSYSRPGSKAKVFIQALYDVYGLSISELEEQWRVWLEEQSLQGIEIGVPKFARQVAVLYDPANDDNGPGDYRYTSPGQEGSCDLEQVEILEDPDHVYFRLRFRKLWVLEGTTLVWPGAAVIVLDTAPNDSDRFWFYPLFDPEAQVREEDAFEFEVYLTSQWIAVCNQWSEFLDIRKGPAETKGLLEPEKREIAFSLPKALTGVSNSNWRIGIGIGLRDPSDRRYRPKFLELSSQKMPNFLDVLDDPKQNMQECFVQSLLPVIKMLR